MKPYLAMVGARLLAGPQAAPTPAPTFDVPRPKPDGSWLSSFMPFFNHILAVLFFAAIIIGFAAGAVGVLFFATGALTGSSARVRGGLAGIGLGMAAVVLVFVYPSIFQNAVNSF